MSFAHREGMGESYRIQAQIRLLSNLSLEYGFSIINEFPPDPISQGFPGDLNWQPVKDPGSPGELCFTWRAFPEIVKRIDGEFPGEYVMLMGTNKLNPGMIFQKLYWKEREHYARIQDVEAQLLRLNFRILKSGFYDSPPWIDAPLPLKLHLPVNIKSSRLLDIFEALPGKVLRAHHVWALGKRK